MKPTVYFAVFVKRIIYWDYRGILVVITINMQTYICRNADEINYIMIIFST